MNWLRSGTVLAPARVGVEQAGLSLHLLNHVRAGFGVDQAGVHPRALAAMWMSFGE